MYCTVLEDQKPKALFKLESKVENLGLGIHLGFRNQGLGIRVRVRQLGFRGSGVGLYYIVFRSSGFISIPARPCILM